MIDEKYKEIDANLITNMSLKKMVRD